MDGSNGYGGYMQGDQTFDGMMNTSSDWPGAGDQQYLNFEQPQQQQAHQPQNLYANYTQQQHQHQHPVYGNAAVSQQASYGSPYVNSPYGNQFQQHAQPSRFFGATTSSGSPNIQAASPYHQSTASPYSTQVDATVSPQYLQYAIPAHQAESINHGVNGQVYQQQHQQPNPIGSTFDQQSQNHSPLYFDNSESGSLQRNESNAVHYSALPSARPGHSLQAAVNSPINLNAHPQINSIPHQVNFASPLNAPIQQQQPQQQYQQLQQFKPTQPQVALRVLNPELFKATTGDSSRPKLAHAPFLTFDTTPEQVNLSLKNSLPKYHPRKSRSGKDLVPGFEPSHPLLAARSSTKKERQLKITKPSASKWKGTSGGPKILVGKSSASREDGNGTSIKSLSSTSTESSSSEDESTSEEESEYEEETPLKDVSEIRGLERPSDPASAARWDAIGIIWKDENTSPSPEVIKTAIEEYGNLVIALRTKIKTNKDFLTAKPSDTNLAAERTTLLAAMYEAVNAANVNGHPGIVENLGGHHRLVNQLTTTLIDCLKSDDFLGRLPRAVFALLSKFQTMTDDLLKKLKFEGITKRWAKKADKSIDKDIAAILANTTDAKERAKLTEKDAAKSVQTKVILEKTIPSKLRVADVNKPTPINPAKRPHEGDATNGKPNKKFASDATGAPAPPKPSLPKKNLLGIGSKPIPKPAPKKREVSPPATSKFGALLDSIANPRAPAKAPEAPRKVETPEEKVRRERRERRGKLSVKWKPDFELVEVREFMHEQAEDEGRQEGMLKDAHNNHNEGMMHKRRLAETVDEDEDYQPGDLGEHPYRDLITIDFSDMQKKSGFGQNYVTRGGDLAFKTPEQEAQERREAHEIMAIYTDESDIPPTPKEPPPSSMDRMDGVAKTVDPVSLKEPTEGWLIQRLDETKQYGAQYATQQSIRRMEEQRLQKKHAHGVPQTLLNASALAVHQPQQVQPKLPVMDVEAHHALIKIVEYLKGKAYPATEPPEWMTNEAQRTDWWDGWKRDELLRPKQAVIQPAASAPMDIPQYQQPQMQAPQLQAPVHHALPYQPPGNMPAAAPDTIQQQQVQSYMAAYSNGTNPAPATQSMQEQHAQWAAFATAYPAEAARISAQHTQQAQQHAVPPVQSSRWEDNSPKQDNNSNKSGNKGKRGYEMKEFAGGNNNFKNDSSPFDENGEYKGKKKPCRFFKEGKCAKGAKCTYLHD